MTEGTFRLGDDRCALEVAVDQDEGYVVPMVSSKYVGGSYFFRTSFSGKECDDTARISGPGAIQRCYRFFLKAKKTHQATNLFQNDKSCAGVIA